MKVDRILEVGVAVEDLESASRLYTEILKARPSNIIEDTEYYGLRIRMCRIGNVDFELMEPLVEDSLIGRFIKKHHGPGLHHVAFQVPDIHEAIAWLKRNDILVVSDRPTAIDGLLAIFLAPSIS